MKPAALVEKPYSDRQGAVLRVFLPFAGGYFLSYIFRTINSVIAPDLVAVAGLDAADLGLLTSAFFLAFALAQLPLGIMLDRFGPRRVEAALLLVAAAGSVVFSVGHTLAGLMLGRVLIGLGVCSCMMAGFKAFTLWFPSQRLPTINGFLVGVGATGALAATMPVVWLLTILGWRGIFAGLAIACAISSAVLFWVVPERETNQSDLDLRRQLRGLGEVLGSPVFWRVAPLTVFSQATFLSIQGLWAGPWLRDVAGLGPDGVAANLFVLGASMICGFIGTGLLAERLQRAGVRTASVAAMGMALFVAVQFLMLLPRPPAVTVICATFGLFGSFGVLPYAVLSQSFHGRLAGRVNTALNLLVFIVAFAAQWGMGALIHLWEHPATHSYGVYGYQSAFLVMIALQSITFVWYALGLRKKML